MIEETHPNNSFPMLAPLLTKDIIMNTGKSSEFCKIDLLVENLFNKHCLNISQNQRSKYFWDSNHYGLNKVKFFGDCKDDLKELILTQLTDFFLNESYYIEQAGISYAAKMCLLADNIDEKSLYASIAFDEACHLHSIKPFLNSNNSYQQSLKGNSFLCFIAKIMQQESAPVCQAILQLCIEGHGMGYYAWLKSNCLDANFKKVLTKIIHDESSHHGSGVIFTTQNNFTPQEINSLEYHIETFSQFLNCTTFPLLKILEYNCNGLTDAQRKEVLLQLEVEKINQDKMTSVMKLLRIGKLENKISKNLISKIESPWDINLTLKNYQHSLN